MAFHKDLTGEEIHETKMTILSDSPITLSTTASAAGVLVVNSAVSPNELYRALSTTPGDWVLCGTSTAGLVTPGSAGTASSKLNGLGNDATADYAFAAGGNNNLASGISSFTTGDHNTAAGQNAVAFGSTCVASGTNCAVFGNASNTATGGASFIAGGGANTADGTNSVVLGGFGNTASNDNCIVGGQGAVASHQYCFIYSDPSGDTSTGTSQFRVTASGGIFLRNTVFASTNIETGGDFKATAPGGGLGISEGGSNPRMGVATLVGGTVTVATTAVTSAVGRIFYSVQTPGGTQGFLSISSINNGTNFTITSTSGAETSTVAWMIVNAV